MGSFNIPREQKSFAELFQKRPLTYTCLMLTIHHLANSRSQRILWLLEELGLPYEVKSYERDPSGLAPDVLKSIHPLGKSPIIVDGGVTIAESGAIVDYLVETYGGGRLIPPPGTPERLRYAYWVHYSEGSAMPPLVMRLVLEAVGKSRLVPFWVRPLARALFGGMVKGYVNPQIAGHVEFWDAELRKSPYFAGEALTGADIMMSFPLEAVDAAGGLTPALGTYLEALHARPAYQSALARGGPYTLG